MTADTKNIAIAAGIIAAIALIVYMLKNGKMKAISNAINTPSIPNVGQPTGGYGPDTGIGGGLLDERRNLGIGTKGGEVRVLQQLLNEDGASPALTVDGDFGPKTLAALQSEAGRDEITLDAYKSFRNRAVTTNTNTNGGLTGNALWSSDNFGSTTG